MRQNPTPAEAALWRAVRNHQLGVGFRRQHVISRWIADFYVPARRLIIEIDGGIHDLRQLEDEERTGNLMAADFHLLRFRNAEVLQQLPQVLKTIRAELNRIGDVRTQRR